MKSVNKTLVKYSLITIMILSVITLISFVSVSIITPKTVAKFTYDIGQKDLSEYYFQKQYEKTKNINDLYNVYNLNIINNNNKQIIINYDLLKDMNGYSDLISDIKASAYKSNDGYHINAIRLSEDNYLQSAYLNALLNSDNKSDNLKGYDYLLKSNSLIVTNKDNIGIYLFDSIIKPEKLFINNIDSKKEMSFEAKLLFQTRSLSSQKRYIEEVSDYLISLKNLFDMEYAGLMSGGVFDDVAITNMFNIANRIMKVSKSVMLFNNFINEHATIYEDFNLSPVVLPINQELSEMNIDVNQKLLVFLV